MTSNVIKSDFARSRRVRGLGRRTFSRSRGSCRKSHCDRTHGMNEDVPCRPHRQNNGQRHSAAYKLCSGCRRRTHAAFNMAWPRRLTLERRSLLLANVPVLQDGNDVRLGLPEKINRDETLRWRNASKFAGQMFPTRHDAQLERAQTTKPETPPLPPPRSTSLESDGLSVQAKRKQRKLLWRVRGDTTDATEKPLIKHDVTSPPPHATRIPTDARSITYVHRDPNFIVRSYRNTIYFVNRYTTHVNPQEGMLIRPGLEFNIPADHFALVTYRLFGYDFICPADLIEPGDHETELCLRAAAQDACTVHPGWLEARIRVYPSFEPEAWEVINLEKPRRGVFGIPLSGPITIPARASRAILLDASHACDAEYCALVVGTRELNRSGLMLDPVVWPAGTLPVLRLVNVTQDPVTLLAGKLVARVIFTQRGFMAVRDPCRPIGDVLCPRSPVPFQRARADVTVNKTGFTQ